MTSSWEEPIYVISVAADLAEMHPQTLRQYDRMGLVVPTRQAGRQRRYSRQDVHRLRTVQQLSREGVSLEGIRRIVDLESEVERLQQTVADLAGQIQAFQAFSRYPRVFTAGAEGDVTTTFDAGPDRDAADHGYAPRRRGTASGQRSRADLRPDPRPDLRPVRALTAGPSSSALAASSRAVSGVLVWKPKS